MRAVSRVAVLLVFVIAVGVAATGCNVNLHNQVLAPNAVQTISCTTAPSGMGFVVSGDQALGVFFTDDTDCSVSNFQYYASYSTSNLAVGATAKRLVGIDYGAWANPCLRVKNLGSVSTAALNIKMEWYPLDFTSQFHLLNTGQYLSSVPGSDVNVQPAWLAGFNGSGIVVDICDDGLQSAHAEISPRFRLDLSHNYETNVADPTGSSTDTHGTGCGGVAAAEAWNAYCGRGAAYGAWLAGHRILFGTATEADYSDALYNAGVATDVSSNSWGPTGCTASGCEFYDVAAAIWNTIIDGSTNGRGGRGKSYVFAAGNEGHYGGDANQYPYTKMKEVMTIAGSGYEGQRVFYSNAGVNLFVNAPTQGQYATQTTIPGIITAQGGGASTLCRDDFGGTSSATPLVAGVIAIIMQSNPAVTNRDVQYLIRATATRNDPTHASWFTNGVGVWYSPIYGFGRVNAYAAVAAATHSGWTTVPAAVLFSGAVQTITGATITGGHAPVSNWQTVAAGALTPCYIEHVQLIFSASYSPVTDLHIELTSPAGTNVTLAAPTKAVSSGAWTAFTDYTLAARAFWGEAAAGNWTIQISAPSPSTGTGSFTKWQLVIAGVHSCSNACNETGAACGPPGSNGGGGSDGSGSSTAGTAHSSTGNSDDDDTTGPRVFGTAAIGAVYSSVVSIALIAATALVSSMH